MNTTLNVVDIAAICHEANRALCASLGDNSQPYWEDAPDWQKDSAIDGVRFHLENQGAPADASHENWRELKSKEGWQYGIEKNPEKKLHPCMVPFEQLPTEQRAKDYLFSGIVDTLRMLYDGT